MVLSSLEGHASRVRAAHALVGNISPAGVRARLPSFERTGASCDRAGEGNDNGELVESSEVHATHEDELSESGRRIVSSAYVVSDYNRS